MDDDKKMLPKISTWLIIISIFVGLFTMEFTAGVFISQIKPSIKNQESKNQIIIKGEYKKDSSRAKKEYVDTVRVKEEYIEMIYDDSTNLSKEDLREEREAKDIAKVSITKNPLVLRWITFHSCINALAFSSIIFIVLLIIKLYRDYIKGHNLNLYLQILAIILIFVMFICMLMYNKSKLLAGDDILKYFKIIFKDTSLAINLVTIPLFIIALIPLSGVIIINHGAYQLIHDKSTKEDNDDKRKKLAYLKDTLNLLAAYLSIFVSVSVIGTGMQRDMVMAEMTHADRLFPVEIIYAYGISFSMVLALFYVPSLVFIKILEKEYLPKTENSPHTWWMLGSETVNMVKLALSVALPLITSIIQPLLSGT